jgi:amino acid adenylation domain-containing protein
VNFFHRKKIADWNEWHKHYDSQPNLQERLRNVRRQIIAALDECPPGPIQIISVCAGDGRDLLGALENHPRRNDVTALLLDNNAQSVERGKSAAQKIGLGRQLQFVEADATLAKNYASHVPADLILLSGFLGHLRHKEVPGLIESLPMFCKTGGQAIWSRRNILHDGREQIPLIGKFFRKANFVEIHFEAASANGFAVARARFAGQPKPLDSSRVLFSGLYRIPPVQASPEAKTSFNGKIPDSSSGVQIAHDVEISIPARFKQIAALYPSRPALGGGAWQPTYAELDAATNQLANALISRGGKYGDRVALLMRHDAPLIAATLAVLKAGRMVVVLNPNDPPERLKQVLADAEPASIVTDPPNNNLAEQIAQKNQGVVCFEEQFSAPAHNPEIKIAPGDPAWLIYTSGSTGRPKGVIQTHRNMVHKVLRLSQGMDLSTKDKIILLGSPSSGQGTATTCCALLNGATLCPFPIAEKGIAGLKEWMVKEKITVYVSSASVFRHFAKTLDDSVFFPDIRLVRFASEPATANDFAAYKKFFPGKCLLISSLSSSETGNVTQQRFTHNSAVTEGRLPIGLPAMGMEVLLLDDHGREVRDGEVGEIIVRSRFLSPGYWRNDALTAERFSEDGADGARIFRSGDLGRRAAGGVLFFVGRKDARVKIHGYRIEISEIESALSQQPEVETAVVSAQMKPDGDTQLVAHVVPHAGRICTAETLRREMRQTLPSYMIPAHFVFLEKFSLTPSGKIDRDKLRQTDFTIPTQPAAEKPATETETLLADIWKKVFGRESIDRHANFFDYGGDSLNAMVVAAEIYAALGVELNLRVFTGHSTLADLGRAIDDLRVVDGTKSRPNLVRVPRDVPLPLSFTQERVWKHSQTVEGLSGYTMVNSHRICGPLNVNALRESMSYLIRRHEILRTTFDEVAGRLAQIVHPAEPVSLSLLDFAGDPHAEDKTVRVFREEARRLFDFKRLPLLRFTLVRIRENEHRLLHVNHHIISDAWSWKVYFRELAMIYDAGLRGEAPPLTEFEPLQYGDYAAHQRQTLHPEEMAYRETVEWWSSLFADVSRPVKLPFHRLWRSRRAKPADGLIWWGLNPSVSQRLDEIGRKENATYYMIRLAAFAALLADKVDKGDAILGTYVTGRNRVELQNMFGDFVNLATLRLRCDHAQTFREWLSVVQKTVGETQAHSEIPYERLCEELRRRGVNPPEIRVIFSVREHTAPVHFGGLELTWLDRRIENMPWGFCVAFDQHNEEARCRLSFDARIYNPMRVRKWLDRFVRLLNAVSDNPDLPVGKLLAMSKTAGRD